MHIETLKIFCNIVETRSFSKTAEKHFLSQSAVSQQLAQLETSCKAQLVNRKKRPIELTKAGQILYEASLDILERYEQAQNEINALKSSTAARVNVAAIFSIGMHSLPVYLKDFMVKHPNVNVHIEYFSADKIYEMILAGDADIGMVAIPKRDKRLEVFDFVDEPLVLVCSPKHHLANQSQLDIHKVQFEKFISFEANVPTRIWIDNILSNYNVSIHPVMEFDNIETIKKAVEINSGVSILPKNAIDQELASGTLTAIDFSNEHFYRPTGIIIRRNKILNNACRSFIEVLRKKDE
jgi:DNA-binding transcriptional LysR family regulator